MAQTPLVPDDVVHDLLLAFPGLRRPPFLEADVLNEAHAGLGGELGGEFGDWFDYVDGFGDGGEEAFGYAADAGQRKAVF